MNSPEICYKFKPLYTDKSRYFVLTGGRGSSKSYSVSDFIVRLLLEAGHTILFTRYTLTSAHISIIPEFVEKINLLGLAELFQITKTEITCTNGSKIIFRGIQTSSGNQTANLKSIQGVTTWVLDEAEELTDESVFDKIDESIRVKALQNRVILILNPVTSAHWIFKRFFEHGAHDNTTYIHTTYLDNIKNLSDSFIQKAADLKLKNQLKYNHRFLGQWLDQADGVVFSNWIEGEPQPDAAGIEIYGQDYGFSNDPTTLIRCLIDTKKKVIYLQEMFYQAGLSTEQIAILNKTYAPGKLIIGDSAEPRLIDELRQRGINIKAAEKGQGSVSAGLLGMQDYQLIVHPESYNLKKELRNYVWLDSTAKLVIDDYNHLIDAARYAFQNATKRKIENFIV
jgi:phage terminase large subunit